MSTKITGRSLTGRKHQPDEPLKMYYFLSVTKFSLPFLTRHWRHYTISISKDNEAARRRLRRRIYNTLRKLMTLPTKLAKESELVL
jgi:hypothetical protein